MREGDRIGVKIRPYKGSDYNPVKRCLTEGGIFDKTWDTRARLKTMIKKDKTSILVAIKNKEIVGCVYDLYSGWQGMVFRLAVLKKLRGQNVGASLMRAAHKELKKKGASQVVLFVGAKKSKLIRYYLRLGYKSSRLWRSMWRYL